MNELNDLFEQILHSERSYKVKANKLKELSSAIRQAQLQLQQTRDHVSNKQGELVVKNLRLSDVEVDTKLFTLRERILLEQRDKLLLDQRGFKQHLEAKNTDLEDARLKFQQDLIHFSRCFDLHGSGIKYREDQTRKHIAVLREELLLLETELAEMDIQTQEVDKLEQELCCMQTRLREETATEEELKKTLQSYNDVKCLEAENISCKNKLSKDAEFVRLQRELEACKECPAELECRSLSQELETLQKKCYHKQMKYQLSMQQKSRRSVEEKCSSAQRGHYNPYTHRFVPAPVKANTSCNTEDGAYNSRQSIKSAAERLIEKDEGTSVRRWKQPANSSHLGSKDNSWSEEMLLVDSEWLDGLSDEQEEGKRDSDDDWGMDFDESELNDQDFLTMDDGSGSVCGNIVGLKDVSAKQRFPTAPDVKQPGSWAPSDKGATPRQGGFHPAARRPALSPPKRSLAAERTGKSGLKSLEERQHRSCAPKTAKKVHFHY